LKAGGGVKAVLLVIGAIILYTGFQCFANYWISHWIKAGSGVNNCKNNGLVFLFATMFKCELRCNKKNNLF